MIPRAIVVSPYTRRERAIQWFGGWLAPYAFRVAERDGIGLFIGLFNVLTLYLVWCLVTWRRPWPRPPLLGGEP